MFDAKQRVESQRDIKYSHFWNDDGRKSTYMQFIL